MICRQFVHAFHEVQNGVDGAADERSEHPGHHFPKRAEDGSAKQQLFNHGHGNASHCSFQEDLREGGCIQTIFQHPHAGHHAHHHDHGQ